WKVRIRKKSKNQGKPNRLIQLPIKFPINIEVLITGNLTKSQAINDLQPLQNLKKLTTLELRGNQIQDLKPLQELKKLKIPGSTTFGGIPS
ncbi:MAG: hypothetical protein O4805_22315, partial [Trichodesmium sp. St16_bin2-tuft]|nr:hypothetical protein [Trichodesmium sp. St16_bin2-tuft]